MVGLLFRSINVFAFEIWPHRNRLCSKLALFDPANPVVRLGFYFFFFWSCPTIQLRKNSKIVRLGAPENTNDDSKLKFENCFNHVFRKVISKRSKYRNERFGFACFFFFIITILLPSWNEEYYSRSRNRAVNPITRQWYSHVE